MQDLKIYIVIEDPKTKQDVSIRGNFDILRAFISGVGDFEGQAAGLLSSPLNVTVSQAGPQATVRPREKRGAKKAMPHEWRKAN